MDETSPGVADLLIELMQGKHQLIFGREKCMGSRPRSRSRYYSRRNRMRRWNNSLLGEPVEGMKEGREEKIAISCIHSIRVCILHDASMAIWSRVNQDLIESSIPLPPPPTRTLWFTPLRYCWHQSLLSIDSTPATNKI